MQENPFVSENKCNGLTNHVSYDFFFLHAKIFTWTAGFVTLLDVELVGEVLRDCDCLESCLESNLDCKTFCTSLIFPPFGTTFNETEIVNTSFVI